MKDWHINLILILLSCIAAGVFYTIHFLVLQEKARPTMIKNALIEALDETYDINAE